MAALRSLGVWRSLEQLRFPHVTMETLITFCRTRMRRRMLESAVLLVLNSFCLIVILKSVHFYSWERKPVSKLVNEAVLSTAVSSTCQPNASAYDIEEFDSYPPMIQDVLLYRHCRSFPMLINVPGKCNVPQYNKAPLFLLAIKSSPSNYERREVLRKTWARERLQNGMLIRTVFLTGTAGQRFEKRRLNSLLELENQKYHDILQWDFTDTFYNLTLKQILFLDWMDQFCPNVAFLFNGDDDVFANTDNMVEYLKGLEDDAGRKHLFLGNMLDDSVPIRENNSKYYIPELIEPGDLYPPYCSGGGYLYSHFTAQTIFQISKTITLMPIDDVYAGMCLKKAGLEPTSHMGVWADGLIIPSDQLDSMDPCHYRELILVHKFPPHQLYILWHEIHRKDLDCAKRVSHI